MGLDTARAVWLYGPWANRARQQKDTAMIEKVKAAIAAFNTGDFDKYLAIREELVDCMGEDWTSDLLFEYANK